MKIDFIESIRQRCLTSGSQVVTAANCVNTLFQMEPKQVLELRQPDL